MLSNACDCDIHGIVQNIDRFRQGQGLRVRDSQKIFTSSTSVGNPPRSSPCLIVLILFQTYKMELWTCCAVQTYVSWSKLRITVSNLLSESLKAFIMFSWLGVQIVRTLQTMQRVNQCKSIIPFIHFLRSPQNMSYLEILIHDHHHAQYYFVASGNVFLVKKRTTQN